MDGLISLFRYENPNLTKKLLGVTFDNPIGLAAGFDYDGHMARVMKHVGFGFNTVGTVTAIAYEGNAKPRLARLPLSQSLLVNKGFKSGGAKEVRARLDTRIKGAYHQGSAWARPIFRKLIVSKKPSMIIFLPSNYLLLANMSNILSSISAVLISDSKVLFQISRIFLNFVRRSKSSNSNNQFL